MEIHKKILFLGMLLFIIRCDAQLDVVLKYTIGGTLSGLVGTSVVLQNNSGNNLTLTANGSFQFSTLLNNNTAYSVTVLTNPSSPGQTCTVSSGSGTVSGSNVTNITVTCTTNNKHIFLSNSSDDGNFGGISGADNLCNTDNNRPDTSKTYKALMVDGTNRVACTTANCSGGTGEHTDWVLTISTPYVKTNGTVAVGTTNSVGLFEFPLSAAIGSVANNTWTGLEADWTTGSDCVNWTSNSFNDKGHMGRQNAVNSDAINVADNQDCRDNGSVIYCVEVE